MAGQPLAATSLCCVALLGFGLTPQLRAHIAGASTASSSASAAALRPHISREVLQHYLSHAVTHVGLCATSPEPATSSFDADTRMLSEMGATFVGRAAYAWTLPADDEAHFRQAAERAARFHSTSPDTVLQACVFETVWKDVERIPVPEWVFQEFGLKPERRGFNYAAMVYEDGSYRDHWGPGGSAPDMSRLETRMWFYYRARRYVDCGFEALHFGQIHMMDGMDPVHEAWAGLLARVRRYAAAHARRGFVLCDAHTHGVLSQGALLFDFHSYPARPQVTSASARLAVNAGDSIYLRSLGGTTPSGWQCGSLPYLVELDNFGTGSGAPWLNGRDEICWLASLPAMQRQRWLKSAAEWLRRTDPNGFLQVPTRRNLDVPIHGLTMFEMRARSPRQLDNEATVRAVWSFNARRERLAALRSNRS